MPAIQENIKDLMDAGPMPFYKGRRGGYIASDNGTVMKAASINAPIGHIICFANQPEHICAEVVGYDNGYSVVAPLHISAPLKPGSVAVYKDFDQKISVDKHIHGQIIDGLGRPFMSPPREITDSFIPIDPHRIDVPPKAVIRDRMETGVRTIDALMPLGRGQRMGLMAGSGVGKSSLLGMITRQAKADIIIIALVGERGREIIEFIENKISPLSREKTLIVAAPADQPPAHKIRAALLAHALALYHAKKGKNILLIMDSITRIAHAQREIGISVGEPAIARGYPPSTFSLLAKLIETGGVYRKGGSVTSLYTILVDGDDPDDPILDSCRSLLDGHIILSRNLAEQGHYPAIDVAKSLSRVMDHITTSDHIAAAREFRRIWHKMAEISELRSVGLYQAGLDAESDLIMDNQKDFIQFLMQDEFTAIPSVDSVQSLHRLIGNMS